MNRIARCLTIPCLRYRYPAAMIDWLCRAFGFERPVLRVAFLLLHRHVRRIMSAESSEKLSPIDRVSVD